MSQKLPVSNLQWVGDISEFDQSFIKNHNEESDEGYFLGVNVQYPENLFNLHSDLSFLSVRTKIKKAKKIVANLYDKEEYFIDIINLKQALNQELVLKKIHRVIKFNQKDWLKPYIDLNTELRKKSKNDFEKNFLKLVNNSVFGKTMQNVRKHRH